MPIEGGAPVRIWDRQGWSQISSGGKSVLVGAGAESKVSIIPAGGGQPIRSFDRVFELGGSLGAYGQVHWSADGAALLYVKTSGGVSNIWRRPMDSPAGQRRRRNPQSRRIDRQRERIATISNSGLWVTGALVATLWGFVAADRLILHCSNLEVIRTIQELKSLRIQNQRHLSWPPVGSVLFTRCPQPERHPCTPQYDRSTYRTFFETILDGYLIRSPADGISTSLK
jgi:hypothetical protein